MGPLSMAPLYGRRKGLPMCVIPKKVAVIVPLLHNLGAIHTPVFRTAGYRRNPAVVPAAAPAPA